jgi:hypothetical protein
MINNNTLLAIIETRLVVKNKVLFSKDEETADRPKILPGCYLRFPAARKNAAQK